MNVNRIRKGFQSVNRSSPRIESIKLSSNPWQPWEIMKYLKKVNEGNVFVLVNNVIDWGQYLILSGIMVSQTIFITPYQTVRESLSSNFTTYLPKSFYRLWVVMALKILPPACVIKKLLWDVINRPVRPNCYLHIKWFPIESRVHQPVYKSSALDPIPNC
jgi:hypothetical protein